MKKILLLVTAIVMLSTTLRAEEVREEIEFVKLPLMAQKIVQSYFDGTDITQIVKEKDKLKVNYEVKFGDGTEVEFDNEGNWTEVEAPDGGSVPQRVVPGKILMYIRNNFKGAIVTKIERDRRRNYEVELSTGQELHFDGDYKIKK